MRLDDRLEALAPHVERPWREQFLTELGLHGASATAISDAMVEVDTHCLESGQSAEQAFGPAADYAQALDLPDQARWSQAQVLATWAKVLLLVLGVWAIFLAASPLARGERAEIDAGLVLSSAVFIALMVLVARFPRKVLRVCVDHRVWSVIAFTALVTVTALIGVPFNDVAIASVPAGPTLAIGIIAAATSIIWNVVAIRAGASRDDGLAPPPLRPDASGPR